jgi:hypothetical protein
MTFGEMVSDVQTRIGSEPEVSATVIKHWINQGLLAFCEEYDFSWLEQKATTSTVASQEEYDLPSDYKRMVELRVDSTSTTPNIYRYNPHETRSSVESGDKIYSIFGDVLTLNPTPTTNGTNNVEMWYIKRPTKMSVDDDSPSDSDIASMPEAYHEALIIYAVSTYQMYDEEHDERRDLVGNPGAPVPGTFYYYIALAKKEDAKQKRGARRKMVSKQEFIGFSEPNRVAKSSVLRI